jgi:hypothetical protein
MFAVTAKAGKSFGVSDRDRRGGGVPQRQVKTIVTAFTDGECAL